MRGPPAPTSHTYTSTSPSATGSWPASSRASTRAMWVAPRLGTAPAWTTSATVSSGWRRWLSPRWTPRERRSHPVTLYERHGERSLDRPVLVVALDGWVDAGLGADGAITALLSADSTELVATFDGEALIDQ